MKFQNLKDETKNVEVPDTLVKELIYDGYSVGNALAWVEAFTYIGVVFVGYKLTDIVHKKGKKAVVGTVLKNYRCSK